MAVAALTLALASDVHAPSQAREQIRAALRAWELETMCDDCLLVVSELVTNAVRYGLPPVRVELHRDDARLVLTVSDGNDLALESVIADTTREGGRGLHIIRALTHDLRVEHLPHDGKRLVATWLLPH